MVVESSDEDEEEDDEEEEPTAETQDEGDSLIDDEDSEEEEAVKPKAAKVNSRKASRPSVADSLMDNSNDDAPPAAAEAEVSAEDDEEDIDDLLANETEDVKPVISPAPAAAAGVASILPPSPAVPPTPAANRFVPKPPRMTSKVAAPPMPELPKGPQKRLIIEKMVLENFKSYAGRQVIGPFHKVRLPCSPLSSSRRR